MGAIQTQSDMYQLRQSGEAAIPNPGAGGTFDLRGKDFATVTVTATGTYTLPSSPVGTQLLVCCDDTSVVTLADAAGTFHIFTGTSGSKAVLCQATDANSWAGTRLVRNATDFVVDSAQIGYADSGDYTAATEVDGALTEIYTHLLAASHGFVDIPLGAFREVDADGDVRAAADAAAAGSGGVLASDTTPILEGAGTTNAQRLLWATGNADRIAASVCLPPDFDGAADCIVQFIVSSAGTTDSFNAAVLVTNWNGGADVTDALTDTATTAVKVAPGTVAAADIPATPLCVTVSLTPPAHAADALHVYGCRILYKRVLLGE
jgi:hypothetical protein